MYTNIILGLVFILNLVFVILFLRDRDKAEKIRFREFVLASKSEDVRQYVEVIPSEEEEVKKPEDELVSLDDVSPEDLLNAIK